MNGEPNQTQYPYRREVTSPVWKTLASTCLGILGGVAMMLFAGNSNTQRQIDAMQRQIDATNEEVGKLMDADTRTNLSLTKLQVQYEQIASDTAAIASKMGVPAHPVASP